MIIRKSLVAAGALVAALGMTACSSDDSTDGATEPTTTTAAASSTTTAADAPEADAPDAAVLQQQLVTLFDPQVPAAEKVDVIENGEERAALVEQFNGVLAGYPLTATVGEVTAEGATATAVTEIAGPHGGAPVPVTFEQVDGQWVISDDSTCQIFGMARLNCA